MPEERLRAPAKRTAYFVAAETLAVTRPEGTSPSVDDGPLFQEFHEVLWGGLWVKIG